MYSVPQDLIDQLAIPDGGFTWNPRTGEVVTDGYAVSPFKHLEEVHLFNKVDRRELDAFVAKNVGEFADRRDTFVGAWHDPDDGLIYLDVTMVFEAESLARHQAEVSGQKAYYDFANHRSIAVK